MREAIAFILSLFFGFSGFQWFYMDRKVSGKILGTLNLCSFYVFTLYFSNTKHYKVLSSFTGLAVIIILILWGSGLYYCFHKFSCYKLVRFSKTMFLAHILSILLGFSGLQWFHRDKKEIGIVTLYNFGVFIYTLVCNLKFSYLYDISGFLLLLSWGFSFCGLPDWADFDDWAYKDNSEDLTGEEEVDDN